MKKAIRNGKNRIKVIRYIGPYTVVHQKTIGAIIFPRIIPVTLFLFFLLAGEREKGRLLSRYYIGNILPSYRRGAAGTSWTISFTARRKTGEGGLVHLGR